jgi:hypothetical protein
LRRRYSHDERSLALYRSAARRGSVDGELREGELKCCKVLWIVGVGARAGVFR